MLQTTEERRIMAVTVAVGTHWGDEGKAKVVDYLNENADIAVRFQGGANAGHTVITDDEKFIFHQIPVGLLHPGKICVIGNGVVFDPIAFLEELKEHTDRGMDPEGRLWISDRASLVMPYHKHMDAVLEKAAGDAAIGTTMRGIGPAYNEKIARTHGMRAADLLDADRFADQVRSALVDKNRIFTEIYGAEPVDPDEVIEEYRIATAQIRDFITNTSAMLHEAVREGKNIVCEGAQATLLDIDHGTYPFVTSSNTSAGGACTGAGIGPTNIDDVVGIAKAYTSRVGNGPFPTEFEEEFGNRMRELWDEYGATTRRPRRCGWLDGVILRYSAAVNGLTGIAVTALDRLDELPEVKICTGYLLDGQPIPEPPASSRDFERVECVLETLPGWQSDTTKVRDFDDLPKNAQQYVRCIEKIAEVPVVFIGVGPGRDQIVPVRDLPGRC
jgi:adenylosuccinate synthase